MSETQAERWAKMKKEYAEANETLLECVTSLLKILDVTEESGSGRVFNPTYISTCRSEHSAKLSILMKKLRGFVVQDEVQRHFAENIERITDENT